MNPNAKSDVIMRISAGMPESVDAAYLELWLRFKESLSEEDRTRWDCLLNRLSIGPDGAMLLDPPLSDEEKAWASELSKRAGRMGL